MDRKPRVLLCEDSVEGILSAIHCAYLSRYGHRYITIRLFDDYEPDLFSEYIPVETDADKALRVADAIRSKISMRAWNMVHMAAFYGYGEKTQAIYRFVNQGFVMGDSVCGHLSDDYVNQVFKMGRTVFREMDKLKGFVRFRELKSGVLFSQIAPKHHQLYLLGEHFADRFPEENWVIYDERRERACLHRAVIQGADGSIAGGDWVITQWGRPNQDAINEVSGDETEFSGLWKTFFKHIEIKERRNLNLQKNMMPKRYWSNMTEMNSEERSVQP